MENEPVFIFVTCQVGAEQCIKKEAARQRPNWRFSYSRPGFLTFKVPQGVASPDDVGFSSTFARAWAVSLGRACGGTVEQRAKEVWQLAHGLGADRLHVWPRDVAPPGQRGFQPGLTETSRAAWDAILRQAPAACDDADGDGTTGLTAPTRRGDLVLDCAMVEPDEWWVGWHRADARPSRWPGGLWPGVGPDEVVSRAYAKIGEALDWSAFPIKAGQRCVDLGCAPGGGSQALLDHGLRVLGIDPADVDPRVLARSDFQHIRMRGADLKRRDFGQCQWLVADMSVVPRVTLEIVRDIVTHRSVNIRGLIMNLKLADWRMAEQVDQFLAEVRLWGYDQVRARQLSHNRLEICVAARKKPSGLQHRRSGRRSRARRAITKRAATTNQA